MLWQWQGNSLFGLEKFWRSGTASRDRRHGYSAGTIEFSGDSASLRHWPRIAWIDQNGWRFDRDGKRCVLEDDDGTKPVIVEPQPRKHSRSSTQPRLNQKPAQRFPGQPAAQALEKYTAAARKLCDIIDLAGLPEDDRHLAMQRFLLRQLFVPLRLIVEASAEEELSDDTLQQLEAVGAPSASVMLGAVFRKKVKLRMPSRIGSRSASGSVVTISSRERSRE